MTSLLRARPLRILGFAAGAVIVAGAAVVITASASGMTFGVRPSSASQPSSTEVNATLQAANKSTVCSDFMSHFAVDIGKSQADINKAFQKAIADTLADEVKNNQLTQAQATAIQQKLAKQTPCTLASVAAPRGGGAAKQGLGAYMAAYETAAASALGVTDAQLKTDLASGQSLSQIAAAQNPPVTEAQFRTRLVASLKPTLDSAVTAKKLTSTQEQALLNRLQIGPLPLWNAPVQHTKPAPTATPSAA